MRTAGVVALPVGQQFRGLRDQIRVATSPHRRSRARSTTLKDCVVFLVNGLPQGGGIKLGFLGLSLITSLPTVRMCFFRVDPAQRAGQGRA